MQRIRLVVLFAIAFGISELGAGSALARTEPRGSYEAHQSLGDPDGGGSGRSLKLGDQVTPGAKRDSDWGDPDGDTGGLSILRETLAFLLSWDGSLFWAPLGGGF